MPSKGFEGVIGLFCFFLIGLPTLVKKNGRLVRVLVGSELRLLKAKVRLFLLFSYSSKLRRLKSLGEITKFLLHFLYHLKRGKYVNLLVMQVIKYKKN